MAECAHGLALMGAPLPSTWLATLWAETGRMLPSPAPPPSPTGAPGESGSGMQPRAARERALGLAELNLLGQMALALESAGGKGKAATPPAWLLKWGTALALHSSPEGSQHGEGSHSSAAVGALLAAHQLEVVVEPALVSALLEQAVPSEPSSSTPRAGGLQGCSALELADLAPALANMASEGGPVIPPPSFQRAYIQALLLKAKQLSPARALRALAALAGWVSEACMYAQGYSLCLLHARAHSVWHASICQLNYI